MRTRRGVTITAPVPGVAELAKSGLRVVLDGELVAHAGRAHDFYSLGPYLARRNTTPLTFCAFDVLWLEARRWCPISLRVLTAGEKRG